jgi:hypothetical protein
MSNPGLIERVLGSAAFNALPIEVQRVHGGLSLQLQGTAIVKRGSGLLNTLCALVSRLPKAQPSASVIVKIDLQGTQEIWQRRFANSVMTSKLSQHADLLREKLGLVCFDFQLLPDSDGFTWQVKRASVLGLPLPSVLFRGVFARSFAIAGVYQFEVSARMPMVGLLVAYRGHLA